MLRKEQKDGEAAEVEDDSENNRLKYSMVLKDAFDMMKEDFCWESL